MKTPINRYGFAVNVVDKVKPVIQAADASDVREAERRLADLCLEICAGIEAGQVAPDEGDSCFTLIELYTSDNYPGLGLSVEAQEILLDGMTLHDFGTKFGPDLSRMKASASKVLGTA